MKPFCCNACHRIQPVNPRNPKQEYCNRADCQRARKREWQRKKRAADPDYRQNQIDCQKRWREQHPHYWREYRKKKKGSPPPPDPPAAKMDGSIQNFHIFPGKYILAPIHGQNIKMDAFQAIIFPIPASYDSAKDDIIGKFAALAYDHLKDNSQVQTPPNCSP
ncbi:MAG: hypothetical protein PHI97_34395 [Desulfobulbus sp.]|nr:hypothetical protein [Desulfobulbus sp.]